MNWLNTLTEPQRESVFAEMRRMDEQCEHAFKQYRFLAGGQGIPVGATHFDEWLRGESVRVFLRRINKGDTPLEACEVAKAKSREMIANHNRKRPKDINWGRSDIAADSKLEHVCRVLLNAADSAAGIADAA